MPRKPVIDHLRTLVDNDRMSGRALDHLVDLFDPDELRTLANLLEEAADAHDSAVTSIETWAEAEGVDKRDCRDEAIGALEVLVEAFDNLAGAEVPALLIEVAR